MTGRRRQGPVDVGASGLELTFKCVRCGRPITLIAAEGRVYLPDRNAFLAVHRRCLVFSVRPPPEAAEG